MCTRQSETGKIILYIFNDVSSFLFVLFIFQKGNPLLKGITSVPWEFEDIIPDYVMGPTTCALFLSLKYHNMNPDYIQERLKVLGKAYDLRVLLVQVNNLQLNKFTYIYMYLLYAKVCLF